MPDTISRAEPGNVSIELIRTQVMARNGWVFLTEPLPMSMTIADALTFAKLLIEGPSAAVEQLAPFDGE